MDLVGGRIEQLGQLGGIGGAEPHHTALPVGVAIDRGGIALQRAVHLDDLAGHRTEQLGNGLHSLDGAERLVRGDRITGLGQAQKHDVAQLTLGVVGDADADDAVGGGPHVFVILGVAQVSRDGRHLRYLLSAIRYPLSVGVIRSGTMT